MTLIYQNSVGVNFTIYTNFDLTGYTTIQWCITKPSGVKLTKTPVVVSVILGTLSYETIAGDLDEIGDYKTETIVTFVDSDVIKSEIDSFGIFLPLC